MDETRYPVTSGPYAGRVTESFGDGPTPLRAVDCPRCADGSPRGGTFTQTFNDVRHRSQACAAYANAHGETLDDLLVTRDDLHNVEDEIADRARVAEEVAAERASLRRREETLFAKIADARQRRVDPNSQAGLELRREIADVRRAQLAAAGSLA